MDFNPIPLVGVGSLVYRNQEAFMRTLKRVMTVGLSTMGITFAQASEVVGKPTWTVEINAYCDEDVTPDGEPTANAQVNMLGGAARFDGKKRYLSFGRQDEDERIIMRMDGVFSGRVRWVNGKELRYEKLSVEGEKALRDAFLEMEKHARHVAALVCADNPGKKVVSIDPKYAGPILSRLMELNEIATRSNSSDERQGAAPVPPSPPSTPAQRPERGKPRQDAGFEILAR